MFNRKYKLVESTKKVTEPLINLCIFAHTFIKLIRINILLDQNIIFKTFILLLRSIIELCYNTKNIFVGKDYSPNPYIDLSVYRIRIRKRLRKI